MGTLMLRVPWVPSASRSLVWFCVRSNAALGIEAVWSTALRAGVVLSGGATDWNCGMVGGVTWKQPLNTQLSKRGWSLQASLRGRQPESDLKVFMLGLEAFQTGAATETLPYPSPQGTSPQGTSPQGTSPQVSRTPADVAPARRWVQPRTTRGNAWLRY